METILVDQLELAHRLQKLAAEIVAEPPHMTHGEVIGVLLLMRCVETHEAIELLAQNSMLRDAMVLLRVSVEYGVNSAYMMYCGDDQTVEDFVDHSNYQIFKEFQTIKTANEPLFRSIVSAESQAEMQQRFEKLRRFDTKPGDKWSVDDRLYKRAAKLEGAITEYIRERYQSDFPSSNGLVYTMLVNLLWRRGSAFVHGTAGSILSELSSDHGAISLRQESADEAAKTLAIANYNLFLLLRATDSRLGAKNYSALLAVCGELLEGLNLLQQ